MSLREITTAVLCDRIVHRAERVSGWQSNGDMLPWRALCGVPIGKLGADGSFEFDVAVALDPTSWRLAANCSACLAAATHLDLGRLS